MWVVAALAGPVYASGVSASWGWRWALVAYLPLLIAARAVMAGRIGDLSLDEGEEDEEAVPWLPSGAMAAGVAIIGVLRASSPWFWPGVASGTALVLWSCSRVLPAGTLCLAAGRRAGIATLMWVCAFFLTLDYLVAPSAHDVLDMTPTQTGWALTAGGIGWSVVALVCGPIRHGNRRPTAAAPRWPRPSSPPRHPVSRRTGCGRHSSCSPWGSSSPRCWPDAPLERAGGPTRPRAVASPPCGSFVCAETAAGAAPRQNHRAPSEGRRHTTKDIL